jgi:hypothetical protein
MKSGYAVWARVGLVVLAMGSQQLAAQSAAGIPDREEGSLQARRRQQLEKLVEDRAAYADAIVARWEDSARETGRWDASFAAELFAALMKLDPQSLLAAAEAPSYAAMTAVLSEGRAAAVPRGAVPNSLGQSFQDLVYTPVTPCRIVDTRAAVAGALSGGVARSFEVDASDLTAQGGSATGCAIPFLAAQAVAMTVVAVNPAGPGYITAWGLGPRPRSSVLNYSPGAVVANTAIVPVVPGGGEDFTLFSLATTHVVVDVLGYFAAPNATRLDCTTVASDVVAVPVNEISAVDASCPPGTEATGGGHEVSEATIAFPDLFTTSNPLANGWRTVVENRTGGPRNIQTFARCCRVPGR